MSLSRPLTLGEIRQAVQIRCGLGTTGSLPIDQQALVDEKIRSAQRMLYANSWWTRQRRRFDITLVTDVSDYDWPDTLAPEFVGDVFVIRASDSREFKMMPGSRSGERNDAALSSGAPTLWEFIDGNLRVYPAPDDNWSGLTLWGYGDLPDFVDDTEECVVDNEALIQYGELLVKQHYEMPGIDRLESQLMRYIDDMRARQSDKRGVSLTGRQSIRMRPTPENRITRGPNTGDWSDWHPWGW